MLIKQETSQCSWMFKTIICLGFSRGDSISWRTEFIFVGFRSVCPRFSMWSLRGFHESKRWTLTSNMSVLKWLTFYNSWILIMESANAMPCNMVLSFVIKVNLFFSNLMLNNHQNWISNQKQYKTQWDYLQVKKSDSTLDN